jgi:HD-GYP domain-containing protein (c-di-GMP phosphodiesterase class II)
MSTIIEELKIEGIQTQTGAFANLLRMRDRSVGMHSARIGSLARKVAKRCELSSKETRLIETASHLHDLGTIAIPDPILHKPGALSIEERDIMQSHAQFGYDALQQTENFRQVADMVLHHHEWYDGSGYPNGLGGDDIPFGSRVIAVLDAYDAMISDRPCRRSRTTREAAEELILGKGTQFDPEVVDAVLEAIKFGVH